MLTKIIIIFLIIFISLGLCMIFRGIDEIIDFLFDNELDDKFITEKLHIERDSEKIYGQLCYPKNHGKNLRLVVLAHGFGVNHKSMNKYSRMLVKKGFATFTFDFLGGSSDNYSDGNMEDMSVITEAKDLKEVIDKIKTLKLIDNNEIYLMGHSQGGVVCCLYADMYPEDIKELVLINPAFVLADVAKESKLPKKGEFIIKYDEIKGRRYFLDGRKINLYDSFTNYKGLVLIFHGEDDMVVPVSYSKKARQAYNDAYLFIMKGEGHMLSNVAIKKIIDIFSDLIKKKTI